MAVNSGTVAEAWYFPVSQVTAPVSSTLMLLEMVYVASLRLQDATTLMADGVTDSEV